MSNSSSNPSLPSEVTKTATSREFSAKWKELAAWVDAELKNSLSVLDHRTPRRLHEAIAYSLLSPGKRLRPVLCLLACEAVGGKPAQAIHNACALEMIHAYSLIHDDLPAMDDDDLRRGNPTCHKRFDQATAILAGDALQPLAFQTILASNLPSQSQAESCRILADACGPNGMVGGQMDDLLAENRPEMRDPSYIAPKDRTEVDQRQLLSSIHRRKTGAMIEASVLLGAIAGQAASNCRTALELYGRGIGIAFQIVDDLLDVDSTPENIGKATGKDASKGKLTFPGLYGIPRSREMAENWVAESLAALEPFGSKGEGLWHLARYILERNT